MTIADILKDFHIQARDVVTPYRYRDALAIEWVNEGLRRIHNARPDSYSEFVFDNDTITTITTTGDTFPLIDAMKRAMVLHLLERAAEYDKDYKTAQFFNTAFDKELKM